MNEKILYFDWYAENDRVYSIQYSGVEDDIAVLETNNYLIYLTTVGDTIIKLNEKKYKNYNEFPQDLKEAITKEGIKNNYNEYKVIDKCFFNYCISKKINDEEEFLVCFNTFNKLETPEAEKEKMYNILKEYLDYNN